ncbi:MAG: PfkB family carbohydrate kinase [Pseudomonadota bacterium]
MPISASTQSSILHRKIEETQKHENQKPDFLKPHIFFRNHITGVGDAFLNMVGHVDSPTEFGLSTKFDTEIDYDRARHIHRKMKKPYFLPRGSIPNILYAASQLGTPTSLYATVGSDPWAEEVMKQFEKDGIKGHYDISHEGHTGLGQIILLPDGKSAIGSLKGVANKIIIPDRETLEKSRFLVIKGNSFDGKDNIKKINTLLDHAHNLGVTNILNMQNGLNTSIFMDEIRDAVTKNKIDMLIGTQDDIAKFFDIKYYDNEKYRSNEEVSELIIHAAQQMGGYVVYNRGREGIVIVKAGKVTKIPAHKVKKAVDVAGTTDGFIGGFLTGLSKGLSEEEAASIGLSISKDVVQKTGFRPTEAALKDARKNLDGLVKLKLEHIQQKVF